jgi:hypothetical protein
LVNVDDLIFGPDTHGAGGADGDTPGLAAVKTGHKNKSHLRPVVDKLGPNGDDLTQTGSRGQTLIAFAVDLTAQAADTFFQVLQEIILTHNSSFLD